MNSRSHARWSEQLPAYLLGGLNPTEKAEVEHHVGGCPLCQAELLWLAPAADEIATSVRDAEIETLKADLTIPDSVRSFDPSVGMRDGPNGKYNYEYKLGADKIPGGTVAGNYTIWVLDGNGERDSQNFNFTVPDGQGEGYILFDQA